MSLQSNEHSDYVTEQEYLAGEKISEMKHEYVAGQIYAMTGASMNHERIVLNVLKKLGVHLENSPCEAFGSNLKVKTPTGNYRYPDCMVVCNEASDDEYISHSPVIIVEVLSRSTRKTDKQTKRLEYMNIPSLEEYVLIEQDTVEVTVYRKNQQWRSTSYFLGDEVFFAAIELTLTVEAIYQKVQNPDVTDWLAAQSD